MSFQVGQKVECIDASGDGLWWEDIPIQGEIYTVVGIELLDLGLGLVLREIKNAPIFHYAYSALRFRPIVERKTDISALKALLNPANHREMVGE